MLLISVRVCKAAGNGKVRVGAGLAEELVAGVVYLFPARALGRFYSRGAWFNKQVVS